MFKNKRWLAELYLYVEVVCMSVCLKDQALFKRQCEPQRVWRAQGSFWKGPPIHSAWDTCGVAFSFLSCLSSFIWR